MNKHGVSIKVPSRGDGTPWCGMFAQAMFSKANESKSQEEFDKWFEYMSTPRDDEDY